MRPLNRSKPSRKPRSSRRFITSQPQRKSPLAKLQPLDFIRGFKRILSPQQFGGILRQFGSRKGAEPKVGAFLFMILLVYHVFQPRGTYRAHLHRLSGIKLSGSAISKRRQRWPWRLFESVLQAVLRVRASPRKNPQSYYKNYLLIGIDGTLFSIFNTPAVRRSMSKVMTRRGQAAFAQVRLVMLLELGLHNPLAVAIGDQAESELALAYRLIDRIPKHSLLLADRLYCANRFLVALLHRLIALGSDFLIRVKSTPTTKLIRRLPDGSALVELKGHDARSGKKVEFWVREIRGVIRLRGGGRTQVRLWTSLLEEAHDPAIELLRLYAQRWEQEIAFKELKVDLRQRHLLNSYTPLTAKQEIAAWVIAQAMLVEWRLAVGEHLDAPVLRVSFIKLLMDVRTFWSMLNWLEGIVPLTLQQEALLAQRLFDDLGAELTPPRRPRSCPRAVRQPVSSWPRLMRNQSFTGEIRCHVIRKYRSKG